MNQAIALWALGGLAAVVGTLSLILLRRVLQQGDDTNKKVTEHGETFARMDTTVTGLAQRVDSLDRWRADEQARQLHAAEKRIAELEREREDDRREGPSDRRGSA